MKALPRGGRVVAPLYPVGEFVFVDSLKFDIFPLLFLSLQIIFQYGSTEFHVFVFFITVVSVN